MLGASASRPTASLTSASSRQLILVRTGCAYPSPKAPRSLGRGRVELRVRWDAGANGRKSRRVPITPKLAAAIKQYEVRHRPETDLSQLLINGHGAPYQGPGIKSMMDRLTLRAGFRVHAHAFRHTFATVAAKLGRNFEHLRAAMGHSDYGMLQRYMRLATERDLGSRADWLELIANNPAMEWS